jgi:hypothetical protein
LVPLEVYTVLETLCRPITGSMNIVKLLPERGLNDVVGATFAVDP